MTESEFIHELTSVLDQHSVAVSAAIPKLLAAIPAKARRLDLRISPAQDGDGFFTIRASLDGPDLYVLNKQIDDHSELFDAKYTEDGVEPPIPILDPFDVDFVVNDTVVHCAAKWLQGIWRSLGDVDCRVPVVIIADEGCGTSTPIELHFTPSD